MIVECSSIFLVVEALPLKENEVLQVYFSALREKQSLEAVFVYFDTATYDEIVKDVSVILAEQLGVIGGTMGLFAGFSFFSALEIVYFIVKYLFFLSRQIDSLLE